MRQCGKVKYHYAFLFHVAWQHSLKANLVGARIEDSATAVRILAA
jgi:hypothetical protein